MRAHARGELDEFAGRSPFDDGPPLAASLAGAAVVVVPSRATPALGEPPQAGRGEAEGNDRGDNEQQAPAPSPAHDQCPGGEGPAPSWLPMEPCLWLVHGTEGTEDPITLGLHVRPGSGHGAWLVAPGCYRSVIPGEPPWRPCGCWSWRTTRSSPTRWPRGCATRGWRSTSPTTGPAGWRRWP